MLLDAHYLGQDSISKSFRRSGRAAECTGLENRRRLVAFREFESHLLRQISEENQGLRGFPRSFFLFKSSRATFQNKTCTQIDAYFVYVFRKTNYNLYKQMHVFKEVI